MSRREPTVKELTIHTPDYIPEGQEHLYPHIGGEFFDYIPEGETWQTMSRPELKTKQGTPSKK